MSLPSVGIDRTSEWRKALSGLRHRAAQPPGAKKSHLRERTTFGLRFTDVASRIAHSIAATQEKLDTLGRLISNRGLYDDNPAEINGFTHIIQQSIPRHKLDLEQLRELVKAGRASSGAQHCTHAGAVVTILQVKLQDISKAFKAVLMTRTENMKRAKKRRDEFSFGGTAYNAVSTDMPTLFGDLGRDTRTDDDGAGSDTHVVLDMPGGSAMQQALVRNDDYLDQRADAMAAIETAIVEVQEVFQDIAVVIESQGQAVGRIDDNVERAANDIEGAYGQLTQALANAKDNKWLMMKVFGILLLFFILFVVVFA